MRALVLERTGRKAVLLLPGGEMRTVRAQKGWEAGMEVRVKPYPVRKKRAKFNPRAVLYPLTACAAALVIVLFGLNRLGGNHIDRQHPVQPLSSGSPVLQTALPEPTVSPTPIPAANTPLPTPAGKVCDECGQTGHDDDHCPYEICDECGGTGHDDDNCPNEICDECGQTGHDDDHCPYEICDECGGTGHDDDNCPNEICDECGQTGHDDDHCPNDHKGSHHDD